MQDYRAFAMTGSDEFGSFLDGEEPNSRIFRTRVLTLVESPVL
jgi:hypothetical protein